MKVKQKKRMAFGDLILAAYQVWGAGPDPTWKPTSADGPSN